MGLFGRKPFYKLNGREEILQWFKSDKQWGKLGDKVINVIIDKFENDKLAFEVFVFISEICNLVKNNYIPLCETTGNSIDLTITSFALTLYNTGSMYRDELIKKIGDDTIPEKTKSQYLNFAQSGYESAVKLDKFMISGYYQLAILRGKIMGKYEEGIKYCEIGLKKVEALESIPKDELNSTEEAQLMNLPEMKGWLNSAIEEFK